MSDTLPADHQPGANQPPPLEAILEEKYAPLRIELAEVTKAIAALPAKIDNDADHSKAAELQTALSSLKKRIKFGHTVEAEEAAKIKSTVDVFFLTRGLTGEVTTQEQSLTRLTGAYLAAKAEKRRLEEQAEANRLREEADAKIAAAAKAEEEGKNTIAEVQQKAAETIDRAADNAQARASAPAADLARTRTDVGTSSLQYSVDCEPDRDTVDLEKLRPYLQLDAIKAAIGGYLRTNGLKANTEDVAKANAALKGAGLTLVAKGRTRGY